MDFETRSEADLNAVGAWLYSLHPSTDVLCLGWKCDDASGQWRMGQKEPEDLFDALDRTDVVEAHGAFFEYCVWRNVCMDRYGWWQGAMIEDYKWRCSMAKAAASSMPRGLGDAGRAMGLDIVKDVETGKWAMMKLSRPRKPTKNDASRWHNAEDDWQKMLEYNMTDVLSEEALSASLPDLTEQELEVWRLTHKMNVRGMAVDVEGCAAAVKISGEYALRLTNRFHEITGLDTAGQRAKFIMWLASRGIGVTNTQADTLDALLEHGDETGPMPPDVAEVIGVVRAIGRSSIKKYRAMLDMAGEDGRVRGSFLYAGAQRTGRWSGQGIQPQNFKREGPKNMDQAWEDIRTGDLDYVEMLHGDPLKFLGSAVRGGIWAPPGRRFMAGDFAQIEPRKLFWLAGEKKGLATFRAGEDIYIEAASMIFNEKITKADSEKRFLGKHAILALGYGAGYVKYLLHCRDLGAPAFSWKRVCELVPASVRDGLLAWILDKGWTNVKKQIPDATRRDAEELVLTKYIVDRYREKYEKTVVAYWYAIEGAVRNAIRQPGMLYSVGKVAYKMGSKFLMCRLPSGRIMRYFGAKLGQATFVDGSVDRDDISYMNHEDGQWRRTKTYGGKLVENIVQASSRDVMAEAMLRLEQHTPYDEIVLTAHDEAVCEMDENIGSLDEFLGIMSTPPDWCRDLPLKVDGWAGRRYKK